MTRIFQRPALKGPAWSCAFRVFTPLVLLLLSGTAGCNADRVSAALSPGPGQSDAVLLADDQMDGITAGGLSLALSASAAALGRNAVTSETINAATGSATLFELQFAREQRGFQWIQAVEEKNAIVGLGTASAFASGSDGASCSAQIQVQADYVQKVQTQTVTPTVAICNCSVLAIATTK